MKLQGNLSRILIAFVLFFNLQAALLFMVNPAAYLAGFGLTGTAGEGILRGMGLLFLMWNIPYIFALIDPIRNRTSLIEVVIMQAVGLVGESMILMFGGPYPKPIATTIVRFIIFDGGGFILLITAWLLARKPHTADNI